jgi:hypothetical protein
MANSNEEKPSKMNNMLGVDDVNDLQFEDLVGGEPIQ